MRERERERAAAPSPEGPVQTKLRAICAQNVWDFQINLQFTPDWPVRCVFKFIAHRLENIGMRGPARVGIRRV